jgi:uncharacterized membrane protein YkoI
MNAHRVIRRAILGAAACAAAVGIAGMPALADGRHQNDDQKKEDRKKDDDRHQPAQERSRMSLDEAVQRAERRYHARVVKAEAHNSDGRTIYVLRLVSGDGRVFTVRVDAQTGNMD